jgi:hypothetical protein
VGLCGRGPGGDVRLRLCVGQVGTEALAWVAARRALVGARGPGAVAAKVKISCCYGALHGRGGDRGRLDGGSDLIPPLVKGK